MGVSDGLRRQPLRQQVQGFFRLRALNVKYKYLTPGLADIKIPGKFSVFNLISDMDEAVQTGGGEFLLPQQF